MYRNVGVEHDCNGLAVWREGAAVGDVGHLFRAANAVTQRVAGLCG